MAAATRTINPLHFEDLEPHRFEDLVRQLVYDFREWLALEATGRQGSDDGFDARGWETSISHHTIIQEDSEDFTGHYIEEDRIWLIQCKREKTISPKKLVTYLNMIDDKEAHSLYGIIFVAACDFSKKSRDAFRQWCVNEGIKEYHLWGKAELEDLLFQPKNDHLLFGYFGISLQIKKRSAKTALRSKLATKRQAIKHLGEVDNPSDEPVLLRDSETVNYPYSDQIVDFDEYPLWRVYHFIGHYHSGIKILMREHFAYLADDGCTWDYEERVRTNTFYDDPWPKKVQEGLEHKARLFWNEVPEKNRATLKVIGLIPYEDILAIDEIGDEYFLYPHIYVNFNEKDGPFSGGTYGELYVEGHYGNPIYVELENQIKYFLESYPNVEEQS